MRTLLFNIIVFLIPFVIYAIYLRLAAEGKLRDSKWDQKTLSRLFIGGAALVAVSLFFLGIDTQDNTEGVYKPAEVKDGVLIPSRIEDPDGEGE